jgi:hypothetical protein
MDEFFSKDPSLTWETLRFLLFRSKVLTDIALFKGQLGITIIFYEFSRYAQDPLFEQLADEQIEFVLTIPNNLPVGMDGLSGIGWGITYLFRHEYVEGDMNEVLLTIDKGINTHENLTNDNRKDIHDYQHYRQKGDINMEKRFLSRLWTYWANIASTKPVIDL